jgi:hypothetical protein
MSHVTDSGCQVEVDAGVEVAAVPQPCRVLGEAVVIGERPVAVTMPSDRPQDALLTQLKYP